MGIPVAIIVEVHNKLLWQSIVSQRCTVKMICFVSSSFAPENLVSRDRFGRCSVMRQPAHYPQSG